MQLFNTVVELQQYLNGQQHETIGLVPTMGALHAGHLSLIEKARKTTQTVVVSIFVNPLQFGPTEDLERYPRPQQSDRELCQSAGVDALFMPSAAELYGQSKPNLSALTQVVPPEGMTNCLCGRSRPTHFQGVATIVTKLLNIVRPTYAFFGQKDAQQVAIIKRLVADLNLPGEIVVCPIVREPDGLALSSRNHYLCVSSRKKATILYQALQAAKTAFAQGEKSASALIQTAKTVLSAEPDVALDYLAIVHPDTLKPLQTLDQPGMIAIAANLSNSDTDSVQTRLIDNTLLQPKDKTALQRKPIIAIDGPAGAGKSTVARQVAHNLDLLYLDTGAMYRALTWFVLAQGIDPADETSVAQQLASCSIQLITNSSGEVPLPPTVQVNGRDVTAAIRTAEVTAQVSTIAAQAAVRQHLVAQQQSYGTSGGVVADGRDIGTQVFPEAELKIYLTASVEERAARRYRDLEAATQDAATQDAAEKLPTLEELAQLIAERDRKDSTRAVSPLKKAPDAIEIVTDDLTAQQVIEKISALYQQID